MHAIASATPSVWSGRIRAIHRTRWSLRETAEHSSARDRRANADLDDVFAHLARHPHCSEERVHGCLWTTAPAAARRRLPALAFVAMELEEMASRLARMEGARSH